MLLSKLSEQDESSIEFARYVHIVTLWRDCEMSASCYGWNEESVRHTIVNCAFNYFN